jgi:mannose-6-phosphate isomerase-like protein (cupin superfamily)
MHRYGLDIDELQNLIQTPVSSRTEYGSHAALASKPEYRLEQFVIEAGAQLTLDLADDEEVTLFAEEGSVRLGGSVLGPHMLTTLLASSHTALVAYETSTIYAFYGPASKWPAAAACAIAAPIDFRDKYWGNIQTMVNAEYTGKRLFFRKGQHSSLHFHCNKTETYFIHSGELFLRLRAGRGEDRFFALRQGDTLLIPPGLMHQDGGAADTVIIEISTHDEDSDSFIVEDGSRNKMPGLPA